MPNTYRDFDGNVVKTLRFIKYAQKIGFSLKEIVEITKDKNLTALSRKKQKHLLEGKLEELDAKIREIRIIRNEIRGKLERLGT